jgi:hypothetical protein
MNSRSWVIAALLAAALIGWAVRAGGAEEKESEGKVVEFKLPRPAYVGTPKLMPEKSTAEKPTGKKREPWRAPAGVVNLALKRPVDGSDREPLIGSLDQVTDGDKEAGQGSSVELGPGLQWVQIDLGVAAAIYGILMWHDHSEARIYRDVVVQVSDDKDFIKDVKTIFNNDQDNSAGLGVGKDREFFEGYEGKLIGLKTPVKGRYVRLYSKGNTSSDENHYTEVEVWGMAK